MSKRKVMFANVFTVSSVLRQCGVSGGDAELVVQCYNAFLAYYEAVRAVSVDTIAVKGSRFIALFCRTFKVNEIPLYVHLITHTEILTKVYGNLFDFQQQSAESLNSVMSRRFFGQTACSAPDTVVAVNRHRFL